MTVIFNSVDVRKSSSFGRGILRSLPTHRTNFTAADYDAYLAMANATPDYDAMADEAAALDRLERGLDA